MVSGEARNELPIGSRTTRETGINKTLGEKGEGDERVVCLNRGESKKKLGGIK